MNTARMLFEKYGPLLKITELAEVLRLDPATVYNQLSAGTFPIPTVKQGRLRMAYLDDVLIYLEGLRNADTHSRKPAPHQGKSEGRSQPPRDQRKDASRQSVRARSSDLWPMPSHLQP